MLRAQVDFGAVAKQRLQNLLTVFGLLRCSLLLRAMVDLGAAAQSSNASLPGCIMFMSKSQWAPLLRAAAGPGLRFSASVVAIAKSIG